MSANRPLPPPNAPAATVPAPRSKVPVIVAAVVGFALVAALGSVLAGRGSSSKAAGTTTVAASTASGAVAPGETQPVQVTGAALAKFGDAADPAVGTKAPALSGYAFDGSPVAITPGSSPMVVLFVAHWCPHCQREVPLIVKYLTAGKLASGVKMVAVATGTSKDAPNYPPSAWLAKEGFTPPVLADAAERTAANAYGLPGYPYFVVLKADGTVAARGSGEKTEAQLDEMFAAALK